MTEQERFKEIYGTWEPRQPCAITVAVTGEHCPNEGTRYVGDSQDSPNAPIVKEYLCADCYNSFIHRMARQWLNEFNKGVQRSGVDTLPQHVQTDIMMIKLPPKNPPSWIDIKTAIP